ncbi:unnamed protein product [Cochlearia groenlandica]
MHNNNKKNKLVFFYPLSFTPRFNSNSTCHFAITLKTFRRDIYRPITGHDRLFGQSPIESPPLHLKFNIPSQLLASSGSRRTCLYQHLSFVLTNVEPRIRETLALYAMQLYGESGGRAFELKADAEDVETHLMQESQGWSTTTTTSSCDDHECSICLETLLCDEESVELHDCCHVFHKVCVWRWIWNKTSCPLCRFPIYKRPKF